MNYADFVTIARLAQRWSNNTDPKMAYVRLLVRHNFFAAHAEFWAERGYPVIGSRRDEADIEFANSQLEHRLSGREKAHQHDAVSNH